MCGVGQGSNSEKFTGFSGRLRFLFSGLLDGWFSFKPVQVEESQEKVVIKLRLSRREIEILMAEKLRLHASASEVICRAIVWLNRVVDTKGEVPESSKKYSGYELVFEGPSSLLEAIKNLKERLDLPSESDTVRRALICFNRDH